MDILDSYNSRRNEIDVIASDEALFLLGYLHEIGEAPRSSLARETGWPPELLRSTLGLLTAGGYVADEGVLRVTASGERLLRLVGLEDAASGLGDVLVPAALAALGTGLGMRWLTSSRRLFWLGLAGGVALGVLSAASRTRHAARRGEQETRRSLQEQLDRAQSKGREIADQQATAREAAPASGTEVPEY